ncbi:MAG: ABC transporter ATP-binding protein [Betaproteobacteria bacterium]|nr:ABC transporter ATP-binding protein [Betaproteobacteria bacterium]
MTLDVHQLSLAVGARILVQPTSWTIGPKECWAILGPNGAGKTMLLHALAGIDLAHAGEVRLGGVNIQTWQRRDLAQRIGLLLQDESPEYWGTVQDYVALARLPHRGRYAKDAAENDPSVTASLAALRLTDLASRRFRTLSGGERQRARIAQLLAQTPEILLLDEPLNHLDLAQEIHVMTLLAAHTAHGGSVVCTLHDPVYALRYCSHALMMYDAGRLELGPVTQVVTRSAVEQLYGCRLDWPGLDADFGPHFR